MKKPITILVNASVYDITLSVSYCLSNGEIVTAIKNKENIIDFGKVKIISNRFKIKSNSLTRVLFRIQRSKKKKKMKR